MEKIDFPSPPSITEEELRKCQETNDYCPVFFEWYKYVAELSSFFSCIQSDSNALRPINSLHYGTLIGLLNRCSRLMLSNVVLSHKGLFGETTSIIDRCIFESCIKIIWLCDEPTDEKFEQFIADGLKTELRFKEKITEKIASRGNKSILIEERMLASIKRYLSISGMSEEQISKSKKLPTLYDMIAQHADELLYIVAQKIGSHHIHGTWPSLLLHYIKIDENNTFWPQSSFRQMLVF